MAAGLIAGGADQHRRIFDATTGVPLEDLLAAAPVACAAFTHDGSAIMEGLDAFEQQAFNLVLSRSQQAFDL